MIRVRVISARGSTPRETGAWMLVDATQTQGTIGGGQLEYMAIDRARQMLARGEDLSQMDIPLGPEIGQCCGGRVVLSLDRHAPEPQIHPDALIFGAGHVGRALSRALEPLPVNATLIDSRPEELAHATGPTLLTALPESLIRDARPGTAVIILTHDHALDFLLAAEALARPDLPYIGMIGSATKRAQFARFAHSRTIDPAPLICPIGAGHSRDKRPELIAAFTAAELMACLTLSPLKKYPCNS